MSSHHGLPPPRELQELRKEIDDLDAQIVALLNRRARVVVEVGRRKALDGTTPIFAPAREQAVLSKVLDLNRRPENGVMLGVTVEAIYRELMSGSFALERQLRVGFLGPFGTFSHEAAVRQFGSSVQLEDLRGIAGAFEETSRGHVDYSIVPVETQVGSVAETLDCFTKYPDSVAVCAEVQLAISQALIAHPEAKPSQIKVISSKQEAIDQCRGWLATQYPHAVLRATSSTSAAVNEIATKAASSDPKEQEESLHMAAIGSRLAAQLQGLQVLFEDIQDNRPNVTRFLVLCNSKTAAATTLPSGSDKTFLLFVLAHKPGALRDVLDAFAKNDVNLSHIEKRRCPPDVLSRLMLAAASSSSGAAGGLSNSTPAAIAEAAAASFAEAGTTINATPVQPSSSPAPAGATAATGSGALFPPPGATVSSLTGGRGSAASLFDYSFFVDADAHVSSEEMQRALKEVKEHVVCLLVLGSFPRARRVL
jgi:chorismate mutase / prephenate dehydratase